MAAVSDTLVESLEVYAAVKQNKDKVTGLSALHDEMKTFFSRTKNKTTDKKALYRSWASFDDINLLENDPYMKWLLQLTNNGTSYPTSIDKSVFCKYALDFGRIQSEYAEGRSYNNGGTYLYHGIDYTPTSAINLFSLVSKTCKY